MAKSLLVHFAFVIISLFGLVYCQDCATVTNQYYACQYNNTSEEFYQSIFGNISNVDDAMDAVKKIYVLMNKCKVNVNYNATLCDCLAVTVSYIKLIQWDRVFLNTTYLDTLKQYNKEERQNLTLNNDTVDSLTNFCRKYEWHLSGFFNYKESNCIYSNIKKPNTVVAVKKRTTAFGIPNIFREFNQLSDCYALYIPSNISSDIEFLSINIQDYDKFLKCIYLSYNVSCSRLLKRKFILEYVLIFPGLFNTTSFSDYINSIINVETKPVIQRYDTSLVGDPHIMVYKANESVTCNLINETCLANDHMEIRCYAKHFTETSNVTVLSGVKITFNIGGNNYEYIANSTSFPDKFTNGNSDIKDNRNKTVVKVYSAFNGVYLFDLTTSMHIYLDRWGTDIYYMLVRGTDSFYTSCTGILVQGCPSNLVNSYKKKKRDTPTVYEKACNSTAYSNENIFIAPSDVYKICKFDTETAKDVNYAQMYSEFITSMRYLRVTDLDVQPSTSATGSHALSVFVTNYKIVIFNVIITIFFH